MKGEYKYPGLVSLRGNFAEGNFGDDALLLACALLLADRVGALRVEGGFIYRDDRLEDVRALVPDDGQPDLIVYGGGTQFFSFGPAGTAAAPQSRLVQTARKLVSPASVMTSLRAQRRSRRDRRTPMVAIGLGAGPFHRDPAAEANAAALLSRMCFVWVRDESTEEFCRAHGIAPLVVSSDLCFTEAFSRANAPAVARSSLPSDTKRITIILRDWKALDDAFFERLVGVARRLRGGGHRVRFASLSRHDERYLRDMAAFGENVLVWDAQKGRIETFWSEMGNEDLVVTSRFHGSIFALLSQVPFVAIEIEQKLENLKKIVPELAPFAVSHRADADTIWDRITSLLKQADGLRPALANALSIQRDRARVGEVALQKFLETEF